MKIDWLVCQRKSSINKTCFEHLPHESWMCMTFVCRRLSYAKKQYTEFYRNCIWAIWVSYASNQIWHFQMCWFCSLLQKITNESTTSAANFHRGAHARGPHIIGKCKSEYIKAIRCSQMQHKEAKEENKNSMQCVSSASAAAHVFHYTSERVQKTFSFCLSSSSHRILAFGVSRTFQSRATGWPLRFCDRLIASTDIKNRFYHTCFFSHFHVEKIMPCATMYRTPYANFIQSGQRCSVDRVSLLCRKRLQHTHTHKQRGARIACKRQQENDDASKHYDFLINGKCGVKNTMAHTRICTQHNAFAECALVHAARANDENKLEKEENCMQKLILLDEKKTTRRKRTLGCTE